MAESSNGSVCANCQVPQSQLSQALKRCARCQQAKYCSVSCQRADWRAHKQECVRQSDSINEVDTPRPRATVRLAFESGDSAGDEDETIFYLRKLTPHLDDITIAGPFYPRRAILEQVKHYFRGNSFAGFSIVHEFDDNEEQLRQVQHFKGPLDTDLSKYMLIEVIPQHNAALARRLPGPTFNVIRSEPMLPQEQHERESEHGISPYPRMKEMEVVGCYSSADEAIASAEEVLRACEQEIDRPSRIPVRNPSRRSRPRNGQPVFSGGVLGQDKHRGGPVSVLVEARYDSGEVRYV